MSFYIKHIEYYLPEKIIDNNFLADECGLDTQFTYEKVGILERRIAAPDEATSDMAYKAAAKLIEAANIDKDDIDILLLCTQNPDYRLPSTACILQDKLGLKTSLMAFDINLGCSGFVYSLPIAGNFVSSQKAKYAMLVMADEYSKIIDYKDRNTASIFGDAASAILLARCEDGFGFIDSNFGTDGSGAKHLILRNSGVVKEDDRGYLFMDGKEIFKFTVMKIPKSINELLVRNNITQDSIDFFIFHQANQYMLKELQKRMKIPDEKMIIDMEFVGNTVSSTIPIVYKNLVDSGRIKKGDLILLSGFGVGLSWSNAIYKYI